MVYFGDLVSTFFRLFKGVCVPFIGTDFREMAFSVQVFIWIWITLTQSLIVHQSNESNRAPRKILYIKNERMTSYGHFNQNPIYLILNLSKVKLKLP